MPRTNLASLLDDTSPAKSEQEPPRRRMPPPAGGDEPHSQSGGAQPGEAPTARHMASLPHPAADERPSAPETPVENSQEDAPPAASAEDQAISTLPRYLQLERKELRVRLDQADDLARLTRRLNRARRGAGERITDNTLIRVAIDLLLQHSDRLAGSTEQELRQSVAT
jgi:hypothetical protein